MLSDATVTTMLPVKDMDRARRFYEDCLGLKPGGSKPDGKFVYQVRGSTLALFPKPEARPPFTPIPLPPWSAPCVRPPPIPPGWQDSVTVRLPVRGNFPGSAPPG